MKRFLLSLMRILITLLIPAAAIGVVLWMNQNNNGNDQEAEADRLLPVEVIAVSPGTYQPVAHWTGRVVAREQVNLTAPVATDVDTLHVLEGDTVNQGDLLISLDTQSVRWELERTQADLSEFDANIQMTRNQQNADNDMLALETALLQQSEAALARQEGLLLRGVTTEEAVEQARANLTQARQAVRQRRLVIDNHPANLASLEAQRERLNIALARQQDLLRRAEPTAPFDGRIGRLDVVTGQTVQAGQALLSLYRPASLTWRVVMPVDAPDALVADIHGQRMPMVQRSSQIEEGQSGRYAWFGIPQGTHWSPGETRSARVIWPEQEGVQPIPAHALYSGNRIFLVDDEQRLGSVVVEVIGVVEQAGEEHWLIRTANLPTNGRILTTRLANILPGMRVAVNDGNSQKADEADSVISTEAIKHE